MSAKTTSKDGDQFAQHAAAVARELFGAENPKLSTKDELRFGERGRHSVDLTKGTYYDHHEGEGFGVLGLIARETGKAGREAVEWMRDRGFYVEDRDAPPPTGNSAPAQVGSERKASRYDRNGNWLPGRVPDHAELTKVYDYTEKDGTIRYQVARFDWSDDTKEKGRDKTFVQRAPDPIRKDRFTYSVKGIEPLPYRLAELLEDIADGAEIFIAPAEKKVDMLRALGVPATCNSGGESRFPEEIAHWFKGAKITVIEDNDEVGRKYSGKVAAALEGTAARVRALRIPGLPPHGNVDDWLPAGGTAERLYELAGSIAQPVAASEFESKFGAVSWLDFDQPGKTYEQLIKGVLTANEMSLLLGESQSGKSFLAIDMAMAVARGIDWFGHRVRQGGVIYQAGESAIGVRRKRFPAYRLHHEVAHEPLPVVLLQEPLDLFSSDDPTDAFIDECKHWSRTFPVPLRMIVIDTFNKATPGANENDGKDMGIVLARCDRVRAATGAHVMLVHHLNAGGTKARGHTSLFANVDNVILTYRVPDHSDAEGRQVREWKISKQKDGEDNISQRFVLPQVQIGFDEDGDRKTSCIVAKPAGHSGEALDRPGAIQLGGANQKALRALYEVLRDVATGFPADPALNLAAGARMVSRKVHSARFFEIEKPDDFADKPEAEQKRIEDAARQALKRARDTLFSKSIIGINEEHIWLTGKAVQGFGPPPGTKTRAQKAADETKAAEEARGDVISRAFGDDEDFDPSKF